MVKFGRSEPSSLIYHEAGLTTDSGLQLAEREAAWLAGFIDGEGWIGLARRTDTPGYSPRLMIANTNGEVLRLIKNWLDGHAYLYQTHRRVSDPRKDVFELVVVCRTMLNLLSQVRPFLRVKAKQADLIFKFYREAVRHRGQRCDYHLQDQFYQELKMLNRRGKN